MSLRFSTVAFQPPSRVEKDPGGWGSQLVLEPGTARVYFTRATGSNIGILSRLDLNSGQWTERRSVRGELRDAVFARDGSTWVLGTFGLSRINTATLESTAEVRRGIGRYQWRLFTTEGCLAICGWASQTVTIVDVDRLAVRRRLRFPAIDLVLEGGRWLSLWGAQAARFDGDRIRLEDRVSMPYGASAIRFGEAILALLGDPKRSLPPDIPGDQWVVEPRDLDIIDPESCAVVRRARMPIRLSRLLGIDSAGRVVATTSRGIALLDSADLAPLGEHWPFLVWSPTLVAEMDMVIGIKNRFGPRELMATSWA